MKSFKQLIESGNAVSGISRIEKKYIKPTMDKFYKEFLRRYLKLSKNGVIPLGSVGKKDSSGDLDLGIDILEIANKNGLSFDKKDIINFISTKLKTAGYIIKEDFVEMIGIGLVTLRYPIVGNESELVQIDLMLTNDIKNFGFFRYAPSPEQSKHSGADRAKLLMSICKFFNYKVMEKDSSGNATQWSQSSMILDGMNVGLHLDIVKTNIGKTGKPIKTPRVISRGGKIKKKPLDIIHTAMGKDFGVEDCLSVETLMNVLNSSKFNNKKNKANILKSYQNSL